MYAAPFLIVLIMRWEVKYALMRAYIEAVAAIKLLDDGVIIMPTEPLVNIVPPLERLLMK